MLVLFDNFNEASNQEDRVSIEIVQYIVPINAKFFTYFFSNKKKLLMKHDIFYRAQIDIFNFFCQLSIVF